MLTNEILSSIDNIDDCVMEAEMNVLTAMINEYDKAIMIMENYNGNSYDCFDIFQENVIMEDGEEPKKENIFKRVIKTLINLLTKFVKMCRNKIRQMKLKKTFSKIKKSISKEELDSFVHHFGNKKITLDKNGDIIITSDINIDQLKEAISSFANRDGNKEQIKRVFRPSKYPLLQYLESIETLCNRIENEIIKSYERDIEWEQRMMENTDDEIHRDINQNIVKSATETINEWNRIFIEISDEFMILSKFNNEIVKYNKSLPSYQFKFAEEWAEEVMSKMGDRFGFISHFIMEIINGELKYKQVKLIINHIENKYGNDFFANYDVEKRPQTEWNEEYLKELKLKSMNGMTSKQFIYHLSEVSDFVHEHAKTKKKR